MMRELTKTAISILKDRYLVENEEPIDMFKRISKHFSSDENHEKRMLYYITRHWFMPSTPILSNGGTKKGLPISCYLNSIDDNIESIIYKSSENKWISHFGGGIGTCLSNIRSVGEDINGKGKTNGIIPFCVDIDASIRSISQGSLRRGSAALYLDVSHPEIEEFIKIRKLSGDIKRKCVICHHGITINNKLVRIFFSSC